MDRIPFQGTFWFTSYDHHCDMIENRSRKQDIESLLYMSIYFIKGKLPWMTIKPNCQTQKELYLETQKTKREASIKNDICSNIPQPFTKALKYVRSLAFDEYPNYHYLYNLFDKLIQEIAGGENMVLMMVNLLIYLGNTCTCKTWANCLIYVA